jgi:HK97 family phage portal protein
MWPFRKKALTATPAVLDAIADRQWAPWPLLGGGSRQRILDAFNTAQSANYAWIYSSSPAVRTVVDVICRNIGQLDLRLYEEVSDAERQPKPDHPAALSLRYPNETTPADKLIRSLFKDFLLFDNAYALLTPAPGNQVSFNRMPAHMVEIRGRSMFQAEGYRFHLRDGTFADFAPEQVLHWSGENPDDPRMGVSKLDTLRSVIAEDAALQAAIIELANAGLTEPVWAYRPLEAPLMSNEAEEGLSEHLTNRVHGRNKRVIVTQEGTELRSFGVTPRDAQMMEVRRWAIEQVAREFGVPLGMVGLSDNLAEAQSQFYADTLPPYTEEFTRMLNHRILVRVYNWTDGCFEFNLDEKLMGDDRLKTLVSAAGGPILLRDEARAMINRAPLADGVGEEIITPLNVIVGDNPKPSVDVMPVQDPNKPPQDGSYREQPKALQKAEDYTPVPHLHPGRKGDLDRQQRNVDLAKATIERHYNRLERSLGAKSRRGAKASESDWRRWDKEFATDMAGTVAQIVEKEGDIYAFKFAGEFDMRKVQNYIHAMAEGAAEAINATIRGEIDDLGLKDALAKRAQHVASAGVGLGAGATRWAREEAARQSPDAAHRVKTWVADTNRHAEFDGDTVPIGSDWPAGFAPGTAPGCACTQSIS